MIRSRVECDERREALFRARNSLDTPGTVGKLSLLGLLPGHATIVEVGAHEGFDTEEFAVLFPAGRIIAFEGHPELHVKTDERLRKFPNVTCVGAALSNRCGVVNFYQSSGASDGSGSILKPTGHLDRHPDVAFDSKDEVVVVAVTLDDYLGASGIYDVDLIWIDVQGAELMVLQGGAETLTRTGWIYAEVSDIPMYGGATTYAELSSFLSEFGFYTHTEYLPDEWCGEGNVLFGRHSSIKGILEGQSSVPISSVTAASDARSDLDPAEGEPSNPSD